MSDANAQKQRKVTTPVFRVSFPNVFKPRAFENQEPKYSIVMLFEKNADLSALVKLAQAAVEEKWPDANSRPKNLKNPFRDGDVERPDTDGYAGKIFITASSKNKVGVVDQNVQTIMDEEEFYAGCYARATVTAYAYDKAGNRGVSFGLQNVQKIKDGEPFTGRSKAEDDFEPVPAEGGAAAGASVSATNFLA